MAVTAEETPMNDPGNAPARALQSPCTARSGPRQPPIPPHDPTITADIWRHPLTAQDRVTETLALPPGTTLGQAVAALWPGSALTSATTVTAAVNGRIVPGSAWEATVLEAGDILTLRATLADGPGGGGDSDAGAIALTVGIIAASIALPALLPGAALTFGTGAGAAATSISWGTLAAAGVSIAGGIVASALATPHLPDPPAAPAPLHSLTASSNRARLYEPMLLVLGRRRVFPDLAAAGYPDFVGNDQYLNQIFHFGLGDLDIDDVRIGTSPLSDHDGVRTQRSRADGRITLVAGNVDTIEGAQLEDTGWHVRRTPEDTTHVALDFVGQVFGKTKKGRFNTHTMTLEIELEAPGGRITRHRHDIANASQDPLRRTYTYDLPDPGVHIVRVRRTRVPWRGDSRNWDDMAWTALRCFQPDEADHTGQNRLALRVAASDRLSGRLERVSGIASQKVPVRRGQAWTAPEPSSNPAWIFRWYARGFRVGGRLRIGIGLPDARIDEAAIIAWGAWCEAEGLTCNHVFDRAVSHAEVIALITRCGRASPTWAAGKLGVVWEAAGRPATALVAPGNIVAGSFRVDWITGKAAEEIVVRYIEPDMTDASGNWQVNTVRRTVPGLEGTPQSTATITLQGVTDRRQAAMEANLQAARQIFHRRRLKWEMGPEGLSLMRGDVVHITHSLIDGGEAGRLTGGSALRPALGRKTAVKAGDRMLFRLVDGTLHQATVTRVFKTGTDVVEIAPPLPEAPGSHGSSPLDILWRAYTSDRAPLRARITAVEPQGTGRIRFEAIDEVDAYHEAATEDLSVAIAPPARARPRIVHIDVTETLIRAGSGFAVEIAVTLTVAGDWRGGVIRSNLDGGPARTVARLTGAETQAHWISPPEGTLTITATPGTESAPDGRPVTTTHQIAGILTSPAAPENFLIDQLGDGTRRLRWTPPEDPDLAGILIRYAEVSEDVIHQWDTMTPLHDGHLAASPFETVEPPPGHWVFAARSLDTGGRLSETEQRIVAQLGPQRLGDTLVWDCPSAKGWPGMSEGAARSDDGRDVLTGLSHYTWGHLTSWATWHSWARGPANNRARGRLTYTARPIDVETSLDAALAWQADVTGEAVMEYRSADTIAALRTAPWAAHEPARTVRGRFFQTRWTVTSTHEEPATLDHLCWSVNAPAATRRLLDRNTAEWEGSAEDGRIVPHDLIRVTDVAITLQSVGAGWTWDLASKNNPTRLRIFDGQGNPADATIDAVIRGITPRPDPVTPAITSPPGSARPASPANIRLTPREGAIAANWDDGEHTTSWEVRHAASRAALANAVPVEVMASQYAISNLEPEETVHVQIRARGPGGTSAWSAPQSAQTPVPAPATPANVRLRRTATAIRLDWDDVAHATRYRVRIARTREDLANRSAAGFMAHDVSEPTYTITGLEPGTTRWVQVRAFNAAGRSPDWSEPQSVQTLPPAPAPVIVRTFAQGDTLTVQSRLVRSALTVFGGFARSAVVEARWARTENELQNAEIHQSETSTPDGVSISSYQGFIFLSGLGYVPHMQIRYRTTTAITAWATIHPDDFRRENEDT